MDAVGGNQAQHGDLFFQQFFVQAFGGVGGGVVLPGKLHEGFLDGMVGNVFFAVARGGKVGEIALPCFFNGLGVVEIGFVEFFDIGRV